MIIINSIIVRQRRKIFRHVLLTFLLLLPGCQTLHFYHQAISGQLEMLVKSRPISDVLVDKATSPRLTRRLIAVEEIRQFASDHLSLPGKESYGKYADLGRAQVSWVLYAAPEFSLEPKSWWYPALGKLNYRGYFQKEDSKNRAKELRSKGYDVYLAGVDAYSTLGWFHDPVLNTFIYAKDIDLAELIFHELTHRKIYRSGATAWNESLADAVAEEGVKRWLTYHRKYTELAIYEKRLARRGQFYQEIESSRAELNKLYQGNLPPGMMLLDKKRVFRNLQKSFQALRKRWGGRGLEGWLTENLNNAHLVSLATYHQHLPAFRALLKECHGDLDLFFLRAKAISIPRD